jgi:hypothetical protein
MIAKRAVLEWFSATSEHQLKIDPSKSNLHDFSALVLRAVSAFVAFENFGPRGGRVGPCHTVRPFDWGHASLTLMIQQ